MSPEQEHRLEEIFGAARELPPRERAAFLERACGGDAELRQGAESLLEAHEQAGPFLQATVALSSPNARGEKPGERVGRYKLLEQIGEGGFGVVWMAEQEEPVRRRVALKIIKLGMDTKEVVARFEAERQALAMMDHANIARVFDGGASDTGRPFFVMELVRGVPITEYCDANKLSTHERLGLFIQVCQAVQHAHQKGVIHRDLKPTNILVTVQDDKPVPKVIDFGVAKATQARLTEKTLFTQFRQWIGTPAYMSPEQAGLASLDVDTRSDVYSLGVLLYELLTGSTPFDTQKLLATGYEAVLRTIREEEPPRPSTRLSTLEANQLNDVAAKRRADPARLNRLVRGDLDWIVLKALEKDRTRRYEMVGSLAADLRHYLYLEPVEARPPGSLYLLGKMVRRHRGKFAAGAAVALSLLVGLTFSTGMFFKQRAANRNSLEQERRAREQEAIAATVNKFLQDDLLVHGDPESFSEEKPEPDLKVRTVLDRASEKIEGQFSGQPLVEAGLRFTLARAYRGLGEYATQERHVRRAYDIYLQLLGPGNLETLRAARELGDAERQLGRTNEVLALLQRTLEQAKRVLGPHHTDTLYSMAALAAAYEQAGQTNAGLDLIQEAVRLANDQHGPETKLASDLLEILAGMQSVQGKWPEAIENFQRTLELKRRLFGAGGLRVARVEVNLAATLVNAGRLREAEPMAQAALDGLRRTLGPEHPQVLTAGLNFAELLIKQQQFSKAEQLLTGIVEMQRRKDGPEHSHTLATLTLLGVVYSGQGKTAEATKLLSETLDTQRRVLGSDHPNTLRTEHELSRLYQRNGTEPPASGGHRL